MEDRQILALFYNRDERALEETQHKYQGYLMTVAGHILVDHEDSLECVNEAYYRAWNSIPPHAPRNLAAYLARITRQLSIDAYRTKNRAKRQGSEYAVCLDELEESLPDKVTTEERVDARLLQQVIEDFLRQSPKEARVAFICRYFYMDSIEEIALAMNASVPKIKSLLHRTRKRLKQYLEQEGYAL